MICTSSLLLQRDKRREAATKVIYSRFRTTGRIEYYHVFIDSGVGRVLNPARPVFTTLNIIQRIFEMPMKTTPGVNTDIRLASAVLASQNFTAATTAPT